MARPVKPETITIIPIPDKKNQYVVPSTTTYGTQYIVDASGEWMTCTCPADR